MVQPQPDGEDRWSRLDRASFGLIYGSITVLSLVMAMGSTGQSPFRMAAVLFGSVLAITLAKALAILVEDILTGRHGAEPSIAQAWRHSRPTLAAANMPALIIAAAGFGILSLDLAILLAQLLAVGMLGLVGGRVGWVVGQDTRSVLLGVLYSGGIGAALAVMKHLLH